MKDFIETYHNQIMERLEKLTGEFNYSNVLRESIKYTLLNSGKMFRPTLLLVVLHDLEGDAEAGLDCACAIEMLHTYALIHDDLPAMDDDRIRRGKLANHLVYGDAQAILAGDALQAEAFKLLALMKVKDSVKVEVIGMIADLIGTSGLVGGQSLDIISAHEDRENVDAERLNKIHFGKTGALIEAAILSAGLIGNASQEKLEKLRIASYNIGMAFQIRDDIYDLVMTDEQLGKDTKSDLKNDKLTYPKVYGLEKSKMMLEDHKHEAMNVLDELFGKDSYTYKYIQEGLK